VDIVGVRRPSRGITRGEHATIREGIYQGGPSEGTSPGPGGAVTHAPKRVGKRLRTSSKTGPNFFQTPSGVGTPHVPLLGRTDSTPGRQVIFHTGLRGHPTHGNRIESAGFPRNGGENPVRPFAGWPTGPAGRGATGETCTRVNVQTSVCPASSLQSASGGPGSEAGGGGGGGKGVGKGGQRQGGGGTSPPGLSPFLRRARPAKRGAGGSVGCRGGQTGGLRKRGFAGPKGGGREGGGNTGHPARQVIAGVALGRP